MDEKTEYKKAKVNRSGLQKLMRLFAFIQPFRLTFMLALFFLLISSLLTLAFPMLMGDLLDAAGQERTLEQINQLGYILLGVFAANAVFSFFRIYLFAIVTQKMLALLRQTTYEHLIRLPMFFFNQRRVGELNSRLSADISLLQETFTFTLAQLIRQLITIVGGLALLTFISPSLTGFMLLFIPVAAVAARFFGKYIRKLTRKTQDQVAASNTIVEETLQGISSVKAFANEMFEIFRYRHSTDLVVKIALKGAIWRAVFISFIIFALFGSITAVIWYGVYLVNQGAGMSTGDLVKFILYSVFIGGSISGLADLYSQLQKAIGATENVMEILEETPEPWSDEEHLEISCFGAVAFEHVSFHYPNRTEEEVLQDLSFRVESGQQLALVGPSGAGKTTITSLIMRFYEVNEGRITIDGKNINEYPLRALRSRMAVVPQDILLFGGSIRENIAYGKPEATEAEIVEAAKKANAWEFISRFEKGLDTLVGERGVQLSGGQRQRIAIARAILKDPDILILDEATSSLDSASEILVQQAIEKLMIGRTTFVIAHRLSTVRNADHILVLEKGRLKEEGTHKQLMEKPGSLYRRLVEMQNQWAPDVNYS